MAIASQPKSSATASGFIIHFRLWRAVDQHGVVLDILMQHRRHKTAANKFFRTLLEATGFAPRAIITDKSNLSCLCYPKSAFSKPCQAMRLGSCMLNMLGIKRRLAATPSVNHIDLP